jgi:hypothetical protein
MMPAASPARKNQYRPHIRIVDADRGLYHRLAAVLEALRGILGDVERT